MLTKLSYLSSFFLLALFVSGSFSQDIKLNIGAYIDTYYATDNDNQQRQLGTDYSSSRLYSYINTFKNEFNINIAQISTGLSYKDEIRGKLTLHTGTLPTAGFASNKMVNIQEAYAGVRLIEGMWLDAGYFLTHIGGESLLPKDNWLSSLSMVTYYEPFFHAGVRLNYDVSDFTLGAMVCNGNGIFEETNENKSFGWFFKYNASMMFAVSYTGIIGNEEPGSPNNAKLHHLHNIVLESHPTDKLGLKAQVDIGLKEKSKTDGKDGMFTGASFQARLQFLEKLAAAFRFAYFDNSERAEGTDISDYTKGMAFNLGLEFKPVEKSYIRLEGGLLNLDDDYKIFYDSDKKATNSRLELMLNFGVWLD